ncbi:MAG TPA: tetratricopeptide repeat protein [Thermoanaerobaculia bacterium]|nr:tetratricopeptide repeat protein [Thermoanaerobaculia bacterium]
MAVNREQVLQSAEKLLSRGKLDQALKEYLRVLEDNAKDIPTLNKVGDLYVRMNRPSDSIPYFERIADFYSKDGFFLKAIAIYKKINKIDPARLEVYDRLADLYHKQGLVQDARSQYQVLADHYQKNNRIPDAISVYKKMAAIDPADLRIQVRLADLYRAAGQKDQAVMQYGLIGSMLLKRGAHDEAAQVFQKALELSPDDVETQRNLVRSLLAQKNAAAAMAVLKAAPRTGESLGLMAEAQLEMGERAEAVRTAEQALALDADAETPRLFLSRLRIQERSYDRALDAVSPLVLKAVTRREFARAAEYLEPILAADPGHVGTLEKMAGVLEAEGNRPGFARVQVHLGQAIETRDPAGAAEHYRRAQEADPSNVEAANRLKDIGTAAAPPASSAAAPAAGGAPEYQELVLDLEDSAAIHAPQPKVASIEMDEAAEAAPPAPAAAPSPTAAPPAPPSASAPAPLPASEDQQIETLIVEAEVFARYGLSDKAIERLFSLVRRRPDLLKARERLVELLVETRNPALGREAEALAAAYRDAGRMEDARRILGRVEHTGAEAEAAPSAAVPPPPPASGVEVEFDEFDVGQPAAAPGDRGPAPPFDDAIEFAAGEPEPPPTVEKLTTPQPLTPVDTEFVSYEQLGNLLEDEMSRAGDSEPPSPPEVPIVEEENLFADEQKFFNLAEELEKELADEAVAEESAEISAPQGEVSLEDIFREFKKGVEQQLSAEDYETHYNLGIAYKEMGLVDEAIGEFQLASKDPGRAVECCSMLGHCFLEKGMPQLAIQWFRKGLETPSIGNNATAGMLYDLARVYQDTGDMDSAYKTYREVFGLNANYRDVIQRVKELDAGRTRGSGDA